MTAALPDRDLAGKTVLIAGGGGIGEAVAARLAAEGARVALGDLYPASAEAAAARIRADGGDCIGLGYDQSDDASVAALIAETVRRIGPPAHAFINAMDMVTLNDDTDLLAMDMATFDRTLAVGLRGAAVVARAVLPHVAAQRGAIVFTSSDAAHFGEPCRPAYAISKSGVNALMRHIASRWGPEGVRSNAILPGFILVPQLRKKMDDAGIAAAIASGRSPRLGEGKDIAAMVAMLMSADGEWINGQTLSVNGGGTMRP